MAQSFGAIYERNAINAAFPVLTYKTLDELGLEDQDAITLNFITGEVTNHRNGKKTKINPFYDAQAEIYRKGGLLGKQ